MYIAQILVAITDLFWVISQGLISESIIVNFSKAFDKVDLKLLINNLGHIGIDSSNQLAGMRFFLKVRSYTVVIDGVFLESCKIASCVSHGSVLGPQLLIM